MNIKINYSGFERLEPTERMRWLCSILQTRPETYVDGLKLLVRAYGMTVDERERLIAQPVLFATAPDAAALGELERALSGLPGVRVESQNEYRSSN
jgi:hypothetical protein